MAMHFWEKTKGEQMGLDFFPQINMGNGIGRVAPTCSELSNVLPGLPMHFLKHLSVILCNAGQILLGMHGIIW